MRASCATPRRTVHGVVWDLALSDVPALDRYESLGTGLYSKINQPVVMEGGARRALVYVGRSARPGKPKPGYLEGVLAAARAWGLPSEYLYELEHGEPAPRKPARRCSGRRSSLSPAPRRAKRGRGPRGRRVNARRVRCANPTRWRSAIPIQPHHPLILLSSLSRRLLEWHRRRREGFRFIQGRTPILSEEVLPPFHRTRTVERAAVVGRARLRKGGTRWML